MSNSFQVGRIAISATTVGEFLAGLAANFEFYRFLKLRFHYVPTVPATEQGTIYLIPDYDPTDPSPPDIQSAMVAPGAVACSIWEDLPIALKHDALHNYGGPTGLGYYVPSVNPAGAIGVDPRLVFAGSLFVGTSGVQATSAGESTKQMGSLYVDYEVELSLPNSDKRTPANGTHENPVTLPSPMLPALCAIKATTASNVALPESSSPWLRVFDGAHATWPVPWQDMDFRNFTQYWDSASNVFKMPASRWLLDFVFGVGSGGSTVDYAGDIYSAFKRYRPSTGVTDIISSWVDHATGLTGAPAFHTYRNTTAIEFEDGDEFWIEAAKKSTEGGMEATMLYNDAQGGVPHGLGTVRLQATQLGTGTA